MTITTHSLHHHATTTVHINYVTLLSQPFVQQVVPTSSSSLLTEHTKRQHSEGFLKPALSAEGTWIGDTEFWIGDSGFSLSIQ